MSNFVPCRHGEDHDVHLYAGEDARHTLCGKPAGSPVTQPGNASVCRDCARHLLSRIFSGIGPDGVGSLEVVVRPPSD